MESSSSAAHTTTQHAMLNSSSSTPNKFNETKNKNKKSKKKKAYSTDNSNSKSNESNVKAKFASTSNFISRYIQQLVQLDSPFANTEQNKLTLEVIYQLYRPKK